MDVMQLNLGKAETAGSGSTHYADQLTNEVVKPN